MSFTYAIAIAGAHRSLNDSERVRYPDADTLAYAKDAVREVAMGRPDLFTHTAGIVCTSGNKQTVAPAGLYVLDVLGVLNGPAITKTDGDTMRRFVPTWTTDTAATAENWWPLMNDVTKRPQAEFYIYPAAPAAQSLMVQFVKDPLYVGNHGIGDDVPLPDPFLPAISAYIVYRCETADDEHVTSGRAAQAYAQFMQITGIEQANRKSIIQEGRPQ